MKGCLRRSEVSLSADLVILVSLSSDAHASQSSFTRLTAPITMSKGT
jgi:hypothetical protein